MNNQLLEQGVLEQGNLFTHKESEVVSGYLYTLIGKDNYTFNLYSDFPINVLSIQRGFGHEV
jgi:hypothetical protein